MTSRDGEWVIGAFLLLIAVVGVALMVEGLTRKRVVSTFAARWPVQVSTSVLGFALVGYGVAFGDGREWFGTEWLGLVDVDLADPIASGRSDGSSHGGRLAFHAAAATLVTTIAMAALAERATVVAHAILGAVVGAVVYPVLVRSIWGPGLVGGLTIDQATFVDEAGGSVLFVSAGFIGLTGTVITGPRLGKYGSSGQSRVLPGWSVPLATIGSVITLLGLLGAAAGGLTDAVEPSAAPVVRVLLSAAGGSVVAASFSSIRGGRVGPVAAATGMLAGVASIAPGAQTVPPSWAAIIGAVGAVIAQGLAAYLDRQKVDDPVRVVSWAGAAGVWGIVAVGLHEAESLDEVVVQLWGTAVILGWSIVMSAIVFGALAIGRRLRITTEEELVGIEPGNRRG